MFKVSHFIKASAFCLLASLAACSGGISDSEASIAPASSTEAEWRTYCLDKINEYRATEDLAPLEMADSAKLACADKQAAQDLNSNTAHGHFGSCGEFAQNSAPNISLSWLSTETEIIDYYVKNMWDEKKLIESGERDPDNDDDYYAIGHYLNMTNSNADHVACGIAKKADGTTGWMNINFY